MYTCVTVPKTQLKSNGNLNLRQGWWIHVFTYNKINIETVHLVSTSRSDFIKTLM